MWVSSNTALFNDSSDGYIYWTVHTPMPLSIVVCAIPSATKAEEGKGNGKGKKERGNG
jgi:hypothetical protein